MSACIKMSMFYRCLISMSSLSMFCLFYVFAFLCFVVLCFVIDPKSEQGDSVWGILSFTLIWLLIAPVLGHCLPVTFKNVTYSCIYSQEQLNHF